MAKLIIIIKTIDLRTVGPKAAFDWVATRWHNFLILRNSFSPGCEAVDNISSSSSRLVNCKQRMKTNRIFGKSFASSYQHTGYWLAGRPVLEVKIRRNTCNAPSSSPCDSKYRGDSGKNMRVIATDKLGMPHNNVNNLQELNWKLADS
jgi:hypothetical protein